VIALTVFTFYSVLHIIPKIVVDYEEFRVDLPLQPVLFIFQVRSCCEWCSWSMDLRLLRLRHGSSCNTNFSEFYGKYLQ